MMFYDDTIMCAIYMKNKRPSHALGNQTPYEMLYGHIPSVKHLTVFGSTFYYLIPKEQRNNLGIRRRKCIFLGYSDTTKAYCLYGEVNKKLILSRDLIFLEMNKNDNFKSQFDCLGKFTHVKTFHEFDNKIPHLEGGIPILDQYLEAPFTISSPPREEVPTTLVEHKVQLDDVIERIGRLVLEENETPSDDLPGCSRKIPKWVKKTLTVEVRKTGTRSSSR